MHRDYNMGSATFSSVTRGGKSASAECLSMSIRRRCFAYIAYLVAMSNRQGHRRFMRHTVPYSYAYVRTLSYSPRCHCARRHANGVRPDPVSSLLKSLQCQLLIHECVFFAIHCTCRSDWKANTTNHLGQETFKDFFNAYKVQVPLSKGDAVFSTSSSTPLSTTAPAPTPPAPPHLPSTASPTSYKSPLPSVVLPTSRTASPCASPSTPNSSPARRPEV